MHGREQIDRWLEGLDPATIDVIEQKGRLYYPATRKRRNREGRIEEKRLRLRVPNSLDRTEARLDTCEWIVKRLAARGHKVPDGRLTVKAAEEAVGTLTFSELETKCLLARCLFEDDPKLLDPWQTYEALDKQVEHAPLLDLWDQLNFWVDQQDVRVSELTEELLLAVIKNIADRRNLSPLLAISGSARDSCLVSMAERLWSSLKRSSSSPSTETSTPEP
jgi:hypothetical protein